MSHQSNMLIKGYLENYLIDDPENQLFFFLQILILCLITFLVIILFKSTKKAGTGEPQKEISKGFAFFAISIGVSQGLRLIYLIMLSSDINIFPRFIQIGGTGFEYILAIFIIFGLICLLKPIEKHVLHKDKLTMTKFNEILLIIAFIPYLGALITNDLDCVYWTYVAYIPLILLIVIGPYSLYMTFAYYLRLGIQSKARLRRKSLLMGFAILLTWLNFFTPSILSLSSIVEYSFLYISNSIISIFCLVMTIIGSNDFYFEYLNKLKEEIRVSNINVSKEQRICLVHKGQIQGKAIRCKNCKTYYCLRCFNAIKSIENVCWACNQPLDGSIKIEKNDLSEIFQEKDAAEGKIFPPKEHKKKQ